MSASLAGYALRASCLPAPGPVPCPAPDPSQPECSGNGTCVQLQQLLPTPIEQRSYCNCSSGFGGSGCEVEVPLLPVDGKERTPVVVPSGTWAYFEVQLPVEVGEGLGVEQGVPRSGGSSGGGLVDLELLVDLAREPGVRGGDPLLFLKPFDTKDRGPPVLDKEESDVGRYADVASFMLQQGYHFRLERLRGAASSISRRWYVGILNNNNSRLQGPAHLSVRAVFRDLSRQPLACPSDCFGQGVCLDPFKTPGVSALPPGGSLATAAGVNAPGNGVMWPGYVNPDQQMSQGFTCSCKAGFGGMLCEGRQWDTVVGMGSQDAGSRTLLPGSWDFYRLTVDPGFNYKYMNLGINWVIPNVNGVPSNHSNAYLTFDTGAYPR
jgi:hypothetical protein